MRDEIVEVLVKCKTNFALSVAKVLLYVLCAVAVVLGMLSGAFALILLAAVFGGAGYFAGVYSQVEYEYVYCDKELDIDVIYSQSKRKNVMNIDLGKMEAFVRTSSAKMDNFNGRQFAAVKDFSTKNKETANDVFALIYDGNLKILIEPNEKLINAIYYVAPSKVHKN